MAMSLKDKLASQLNANNEEMQKAKEEAKKPSPKPISQAQTVEEPKAEKTPKKTAVEKTATTSKPAQTTAKKTPEQPRETKTTPAQVKSSSSKSFDSWVNQTYSELDEIYSDDEREYKPITVDIDNWKYIDETARTISNTGRKITHNEYIELLIKKEVDEFNALSQKEKDIVQATVFLKNRTNKTKTVGLRPNYWNAFNQLCIIHGHCSKCDLMNLLIEKDIDREHPKAAAITKITL